MWFYGKCILLNVVKLESNLVLMNLLCLWMLEMKGLMEGVYCFGVLLCVVFCGVYLLVVEVEGGCEWESGCYSCGVFGSYFGVFDGWGVGVGGKC